MGNEKQIPELNNYFMHGIDAIDPKEKIALIYSENNTSVHLHDFIEIVYFCHGVGTHYVEDKQYNVFPGCVCVLNSNVKHYYGVEQNYCKKVGVKNLIFYSDFLGCESKDFLEEFMCKKGYPVHENQCMKYIHVSSDADKEIEQCFQLVEKEMTAKKGAYLQVVKNLVEVILLLLMSDREQRIEGKKYNRNFIRIEESIKFLNDNIRNIPTMKEIAKMYNLSTEYYSKLFRLYTGKQYIQFVQELKCNEATRLLLGTEYTNEAIAELCGFSSTKYFYQQFKKYKGVTPKEYIKQNYKEKK